LPKLISFVEVKNNEIHSILGLNVKNMTLGERSATGMYAEKGSFIVSVNGESRFTGILKPMDVLLSYNDKIINNVRDLQEAVITPNWTDSLKIVVFRGGGVSTIKVKK
jgi:S1-C subfamily serine protease